MANAMSIEADVLLCGYDVGFFDKTDIERWADHQIAIIDEPSTELLDLSMIRNTHPLDVMNTLRKLGSADPLTSVQTRIGFIGLLFDKNRIDTRLAIRGLWSLILESGITDAQKSQIYYLDDGYDLAVAGTYGSLDDVERELRDFVTPYADRLAEEHPRLFPSTKQS